MDSLKLKDDEGRSH